MELMSAAPLITVGKWSHHPEWKHITLAYKALSRTNSVNAPLLLHLSCVVHIPEWGSKFPTSSRAGKMCRQNCCIRYCALLSVAVSLSRGVYFESCFGNTQLIVALILHFALKIYAKKKKTHNLWAWIWSLHSFGSETQKDSTLLQFLKCFQDLGKRDGSRLHKYS